MAVPVPSPSEHTYGLEGRMGSRPRGERLGTLAIAGPSDHCRISFLPKLWLDLQLPSRSLWRLLTDAFSTVFVVPFTCISFSQIAQVTCPESG